MATRYVHPFPARMAPQLALDALQGVRPGARVLDPMCGSGTVLTESLRQGLAATGRDIDPLAVLMSRVATTKPDLTAVRDAAIATLKRAHELLGNGALSLPAIDNNPQATAFVRFWFASKQEQQLRALALALLTEHGATSDLLKLALSRLIIRKEPGASLARDTAHSRPHRVWDESSFDVLDAFIPSVEQIVAAIDVPCGANSSVRLGDARNLADIENGSIAAVVTSPPYLNAIDYLRGHRLALIWLGEPLDGLRRIRSASIGAERAPTQEYDHDCVEQILRSCRNVEALPGRSRNMLRRFAGDMDMVLAETSRVLEENGRAVFIIGNSSIRGVAVDNAAIVATVACRHGLLLTERFERDLPPTRRYLPPPSASTSSLARRMRTETILTFGAPAQAVDKDSVL